MKSRTNLASILTVALTIALLPSVTYASVTDANIRVLLTRLGHPSSVTFSPTAGQLSISTPESKIAAVGAEISIQGSQVSCKAPDGQTIAGQSLRIEPTDLTQAIRVQCPGQRDRCLRGAIEVRAEGTGIALINEVSLEDYVAGVLPAEMPDSFPIEALKAQAVTIRTYALRNKGKHRSAGCDVCDSDHCEVYAGLTDGKPQCLRAVEETAGTVLTYNGDLAHVFFSTDGGGSTQNYTDSYPDREIPYLCGVTDPEGVPHTTWEKSYTLAELAAIMAGAGIKEAEGLTAIRISDSAQTGRVRSLEITSPAGTKKLYATQFRRILGLDEVRSTLFTIETSDKGVVTVSGRGYGHGIGLCQIGAKGLAQPPFSYTWEQILGHYFPGTSITRGSVTRVAQAPLVSRAQPAVPASRPAAHTQQPVPKISQPAPTQKQAAKPAPKPGKPTVVERPKDKLTFDVRLVSPDLP